MKQTFSILILVFIAMLAKAEQYEITFDKEAYKKEQHKYITCKAKLSPNEATNFFAIFDVMRDEEAKVFEQIRNVRKEKPTTDKEFRSAVQRIDKFEIKLKQIQEQYHNKLFKAIPAKKVYDALRASDSFDKEKFREMNRKASQNKKQNNKEKK